MLKKLKFVNLIVMNIDNRKINFLEKNDDDNNNNISDIIEKND